jgi:PKD repeat protein
LCVLVAQGALSAATVPLGFTESPVPGPWSDAVGTTFENNGRMYVWERTGKVWFQDSDQTSPTLLLNISEEVGAWEDHGMLGFALDPNFRANGYIYLLYVVDRYYLFNFGTPTYDPSASQNKAPTIGRLTRYTCRSSDGFRSVDLSSRFILIGGTRQTGIPVMHWHGVGSLVFGEDGTLLVTTGDGSTSIGVDQGGNADDAQAVREEILRPKEAIGALRSQLVDCLAGKVLRVDPATGDGLTSNPFYDPANPRAPRSRVWALGLRNPYRMSLRPNTGSHYPSDGNPGVLYVGNVGWNNWESLVIIKAPKQNFGWPLYEGLSVNSSYHGNVANQDAPNPFFPAAGCSQYFTFADLLKEDTLAPSGQSPFNNPCNSSQKIPNSIPQFLHSRPVLDWSHSTSTTRTPTYGGSGQAQTANVGYNDSPVSGTGFQGNCIIGGTWYTGTNFPPAYQNRFYFADWAQGIIKTITFDANDGPVALDNFATNAGAIASIAQNPVDGSLYYVGYNFAGATITRLAYTGNRTPIAVASADRYYGPTPLSVQLRSNDSSDPEGKPITYSWNFGDGSPANTQANPVHIFSAPVGVPTKFTVTLTVTDSDGLSAQKSIVISGNNTPPNVRIKSPLNGSLFPPFNATSVKLDGAVSDAESTDARLHYQWRVLLHHNNHDHGSPIDANHSTSAVIEPTGCDEINFYYYRILLTVTDPSGLWTTQEVRLFPDCGPKEGPYLAQDTLPISALLADPTLGLYDTNGTLVVGNGETENDPFHTAEITAYGFALSNARETDIATTLQPGLYTALLSGMNYGTGPGLTSADDVVPRGLESSVTETPRSRQNRFAGRQSNQ